VEAVEAAKFDSREYVGPTLSEQIVFEKAIRESRG
jgi:hypothetical protein